MEDDVRRLFGLVWPTHVSSLTQLLIAAREAFDGDLDMFLVLAIIGDRTFSSQKADPKQDFHSWQRQGSLLVAPQDINVRSIAEYSGIPRETVRRKLSVLMEKGWVIRNDDNILAATPKARHELEPLTHASIHYLGQMFDLLGKMQRRT